MKSAAARSPARSWRPPSSCRKKLPRSLVLLIDDSKKMTAERRELALLGLRDCGAIIALGAASVSEIAELNILHAAMLAMRRALHRLPQTPDHVLVDGNRAPGCTMPCTPIIGGDGISLSIAAASIAAKVVRDRLMARLALRYPRLWLGQQRRLCCRRPPGRDFIPGCHAASPNGLR